MNLYAEFEWRGMLYDATDGAREALAKDKVTAYIGFDPTASSLHVGSLLPIMALARLQRFGHSPIALVGGGTGMIGDPSGKSQERTLLSIEQIDANARGMRAQLERFLDFSASPNAARMMNNADWLRKVGMLEFLRDTGKHFTVNYMLAKESVKRRIGTGEDGVSFTEFSYMLLQAHDYLHLHNAVNCTLQLGGSDQWGNIVAGCDLVRKVRGAKVNGVVMPLVTTASGTKFGKTEAGTVWLDPERTSPFKFYQFWLNTDDRDVVKYLKFFTFLDRAMIAALEQAVVEAPERREAQRTLAREVTALVHGPEELARAERATELMHGGGAAQSAADILAVSADVPTTMMSMEQFVKSTNTTITVAVGLAESNGAAARLIKQGGIYINDQRVTDERGSLTAAQLIDGQVLMIRKGQRDRRIVRIG
jgi:tyrosyl-tRNA synthetase